MDDRWFVGSFVVASAYFGLQLLSLLPVLVRLAAALRAGRVRWPGPLIVDPRSREDTVRVRLGIPPRRLLPAFGGYVSGIAGAFVFSLLSLISEAKDVAAPRPGSEWLVIVLTGLAFAGGIISVWGARRLASQVFGLLAAERRGVERPQAAAATAEGEYAIAHPLDSEVTSASNSTARALNLYVASLAYYHAGAQAKAISAYQQALELDPMLHQHARERLLALSRAILPDEAGPVYYWLGIHSDQLGEPRQAAGWYAKAARAFGLQGYTGRQGRAYCNLGTVQLKYGDPTQALASYEKAVALNPGDGAAYINIGMLFYLDSDQTEPGHARALEAFARAVAADPDSYAPVVAGRMRSYAYTWKEDLENVLRRAAELRREAAR